MSKRRVAIVGAGIVGLAHARAAALKGHDVTVYERDTHAVGASIRNFGLGLILGQPLGELFDLASESRETWLEVLPQCGGWHKAKGCLVIARDAIEWHVLQAFHAEFGSAYQTSLRTATDLSRDEMIGVGALQSPKEIALDSRHCIPKLTRWLQEKHGVRFEFGTQVHAMTLPEIETSRGIRQADQVIICAGHELQTLYPTQLSALNIDLCSLQMLRVANPGRTLNPALLTGLSALHYPSFRQSAALLSKLEQLKGHVQQHEPFLIEHGIHLIVQQVGPLGDLIIGDSHHYGKTPSPFQDAEIDEHLLQLATSLLGQNLKVIERWQGVYASGARPYEILQPEPKVSAVVMTSGIGMSIAFGLAERHIDSTF